VTITPNLHDATLLGLSLTWGKQPALTVRFRTSGLLIVTLTAQRVKLLHCPQVAPWGPSVSVNDVRGPRDAGNGFQRFEIEVQSGDVIVVEAQRFEWGTETSE
jgi:hypothetical protein